MSIWITIIVGVITIGITIYFVYRYGIHIKKLFVIFILGGLFSMSILNLIESKQPKPIDVYRGKTTLKISYIDSIPQDTLVIWNNLYYNGSN